MATRSTQSTQYDSIGTAYMEMKKAPLARLQDESARTHLGSIDGQKVLDLATGRGYFALKLISWGVELVTGIDISPGMITTAREQLPEDLAGRVRYYVGDATCPDLLDQLGLSGDKGAYDTVFAGFLLHYAGTPEDMGRMFRNVYKALKPGGRFVTITVNPLIIDKFGPDSPLGTPETGSTYHVIDTSKHGHKMRVTGYSKSGTVHFDCYYPTVEVYDAAAKLGGFPDLTWYPILPGSKEVEEQGRDFWAEASEKPKSAICIATKPSA